MGILVITEKLMEMSIRKGKLSCMVIILILECNTWNINISGYKTIKC